MMCRAFSSLTPSLSFFLSFFVFRYLTVEVADSSTENILVHFPMVQAFIDQALAGNGRVLLHGNAGISRR